MDEPHYFIVRVYRRAPGANPELEGVVETIATRGLRPFTSGDELWEILRGTVATAPRSPTPVETVVPEREPMERSPE